MKHTPGPWEVLPAEEGVSYLRVRGTQLGKKYKIANVHSEATSVFDSDEAIANARLIAAAPELYEKAETLVLMHVAEQEGLCPPSPQQWMDAVDALAQVLAKARGEK